ncbi:Transcriptional regulatory protein ros [Ensifer sesbaniae]|nr:MucR family transcriptional regulator [Ensifer sesbaniae]NRQ19245.1 Transcriptional regulatory protein ros [Ensifer sesbaniae]
MRKLRSNANERQLKLAGKIVAAYLMRNVVSIDDLPHVIQQTHAALRSASPIFQSKEEPVVGKRRPAVPIRKSVAEDFIICLEDGKKFKLLRRHLMAKYGLTPEQYRRKWGLPADYPMIAPSYARQRSRLAASRWSRKEADVPSTVRTGPPISAIMEPAWSLQELF